MVNGTNVLTIRYYNASKSRKESYNYILVQVKYLNNKWNFSEQYYKKRNYFEQVKRNALHGINAG